VVAWPLARGRDERDCTALVVSADVDADGSRWVVEPGQRVAARSVAVARRRAEERGGVCTGAVSGTLT